MPSLTDIFRTIVAEPSDPLVAMARVGKIASVARQFQDPASQQILGGFLLPWAMKVAEHAPTKWLLPKSVPPICAFENGAMKCAGQAIGGCHICGRPICLQHGFVDFQATLVCWPCMKLAAAHAKPWEPPRREVPKQEAEDDLLWAYTLLGVEESCSDKELKRAYKAIVARYHPDKAASEREAAMDGNLLKSAQAAYAAIEAQRKKR